MMNVELYKNGQFRYRVEVWIFAPWHVQALPMVALRVWIRGRAGRGWIHWLWIPSMDGILGLFPGLAPRAGVRYGGQGSGTTRRALPAVTPCFPAGGAGAARP